MMVGAIGLGVIGIIVWLTVVVVTGSWCAPMLPVIGVAVAIGVRLNRVTRGRMVVALVTTVVMGLFGSLVARYLAFDHAFERVATPNGIASTPQCR